MVGAVISEISSVRTGFFFKKKSALLTTGRPGWGGEEGGGGGRGRSWRRAFWPKRRRGPVAATGAGGDGGLSVEDVGWCSAALLV